MTSLVIATGYQAANQHWAETFAKQQPDWDIRCWEPGDRSFEADFAIVWSPPKELFADHPSIKAIFNIGAGVDGIDFNAIPADLPVYRVEDGGMSGQMTEYAIYGILLANQRFALYSQYQAERKWHRLAPVYREQWPVGIMGYGQIGEKVAQAIRLMGYPVSTWVRSPRPQPKGINLYAGDEQLSDFLAQSRILINVLPLTASTRGILNADTFTMMPQGSFIINMARGAHMVDEDLLAALDSGQLSGALLDVFHTEPLPEEHPFWTHPNIHITPHIAGISLREPTTKQIIEKILAFQAGQSVSGEIQRARSY